MKRPPRQLLAVEPVEPRTLLDAVTLLIGTWNVDIADTGGANRDAAAFQEVFRALGQLDLLTVTEVRSNAVSGSNNDTEWLTQQLDAVYGAGTYTHPTENAPSPVETARKHTPETRPTVLRNIKRSPKK